MTELLPSSSSQCDCERINCAITQEESTEEEGSITPIRTLRLGLPNALNLQWFQDKIDEFEVLHPNIHVVPVISNSTGISAFVNEVASTCSIHSKETTASLYDMFFMLSMVGMLVENNEAVMDLTDYIKEKEELLQWSDIFQYYRQYGGVYNKRFYMFPITNNAVLMFYNKAMFDAFNRTVPRTWDEYNNEAQFFHGLQFQNKTIYGSCLRRQAQCGTAVQFEAILGSVVQLNGTEAGSMFHPIQRRVCDKQAIMKTFEIMQGHAGFGHPTDFEEYTSNAQCINFPMLNNECALGYGYTSQLLNGYIYPQVLIDANVGFSPLPGIANVYNSYSKSFEKCNGKLCPHSKNVEGIGLVNHSPYLDLPISFGVSARATPSIKDDALAFLEYVYSSSYDEVYEKDIYTIMRPTRSSHLNQTIWIERGYDEVTTFEMLNAYESVNSPNANLQLSFGNTMDLRVSLNQIVTGFILSMSNMNYTNNVLATFTDRFWDELNNFATVDYIGGELAFYSDFQRALGIFVQPSKQKYLPISIRVLSLVLGSTVIISSIFSAKLFYSRRECKVLNLLGITYCLFLCVAALLLGIAILFQAFDDSWISGEVVDISCQLQPWLYTQSAVVIVSMSFVKASSIWNSMKTDDNVSTPQVTSKEYLKSAFIVFFPILILTSLYSSEANLKWERAYINDIDPFSNKLPDTWGRCQESNPGAKTGAYITITLLYLLIISIWSLFILYICKFKHPERLIHFAIVTFTMQNIIIGYPIIAFTFENPVAFCVTTILLLFIFACIFLVPPILAVTIFEDVILKKFESFKTEHARKRLLITDLNTQLTKIKTKNEDIKNSFPHLQLKKKKLVSELSRRTMMYVSRSLHPLVKRNNKGMSENRGTLNLKRDTD